MNCYCYYTATHSVMAEHLAKTATAAGLDFIRCYDRAVIGHEWTSAGMIEFALRNTYKLCYETIPNGELKMWCGADHIFFGDFQKYIVEYMENYDIVYSDDAGMFCQDFCVYKDTIPVRMLFAQKAWALFEASASCTKPFAKNLKWINDQKLMTRIINTGHAQIRIGKIPKNIVSNYPACVGRDKGRWRPGVEFELPHTALAFHANWTVGVPNKMALLEYVSRKQKTLTV